MSEAITAEIVLAEPVTEQLAENASSETVEPTTLTIPSRWNPGRKLTHAEAVSEVEQHVKLLAEGSKRLCGLYLRICDTMRTHAFTNDEMRRILSKHFPPARVSEFIRIVNASDDIYRRYQAQLIGFRAALQQCRGYRVNNTAFLKRKKVLRAAYRLIKLLENKSCAFETGGFKFIIQPADTQDTTPAIGLPSPEPAVKAREDELKKIVQMRHLGEKQDVLRDQIWMMRAALKIGQPAMARKLEISKGDYYAMESKKRELPAPVWETIRKNFTLLKANMAARAPAQ